MTKPVPITQRASTEWARLRLSVELLLERRLLWVVCADILILLQGIVAAFISNGEPDSIYFWVVLVPLLVLGVPILANAVPLERRAGSLDLVLCSPEAHAFFVRRIASFCGLIVVQGWLMLAFTRLLGARPFPLVFAMAQTLLVGLLVAAVTLFWNLYLKNSGTVTLASIMTLLALGRWFFAAPLPDPETGLSGILSWLENSVALAAAAVLFYLYARRRLARAEALLSD